MNRDKHYPSITTNIILHSSPNITHQHRSPQIPPCIIMPRAPAVVEKGNSLISLRTKDHIPPLSPPCLFIPLDPVLILPVKLRKKL